MNNKYFEIDDITWNDLDMDEVLKKMDIAQSSVGKENLKLILKNLCMDEDELKKRDSICRQISDDSALTAKLKKIFKNLGKVKKISFRDFIFRLNELKPQSNLKHYILIVLLLLAIASIFFQPVIGIIAIVVMFSVNIAIYFSDKAKIESYFLCLKYLASMVICARRIVKLNLSGTALQESSEKLEQLSHTFAKVRRGSWLITNSVSGSIVDVIMDYIRMLFHVDLIKFNTMRQVAVDNSESIDELFKTLGEIEVCICIANYRKQLDVYTLPDFNNCSNGISFEGIAHPLISEPVRNSMSNAKAILLTGSNASGKSTFLKSVAINQIFAQTIYTCLAEKFNTSFFKVISSMALNDNILNNESYFVVEVKSLKRIFDEIGEAPVMCFVDEVLRGTNTKERVAASSAVLEKLSSTNAVVFAATHDIELTSILANVMKNYHFSETVSDNSVIFDYNVKEGFSTSSNAIRLMESFGFDAEIVNEAKSLVKKLYD